MIQRPQEDHADLGLIEDDDTEMLTAPVEPSVGALDGGRLNTPITRKASS